MNLSRTLKLLMVLTLVVGFLASTGVSTPQPISAQDGGVYSSDPVTPLIFRGDLRDLPQASMFSDGTREVERRITNPDAVSAAPSVVGGDDPLLAAVPPVPTILTATTRNFDGIQYQGVNPSDTIGDVGPNHFVQMTNSSISSAVRIWDKASPLPNQLANTTLAALWVAAGGTGDCTSGFGDPIVMWDSLADRWFISEFASNNTLCVMVSMSPDPVGGGWFLYAFANVPGGFPDYPKYAVWPDAYYMTANQGAPSAWAFDRTQMLAGNPATFLRFTATALSGFSFQALTPADLDGATPPPGGSPGIFMRQVDCDAHTGYGPCGGGANADRLEMFFFSVDFVIPGNSTFTGPTAITVADFDSDLCGLVSFTCFPQPAGGLPLDPLREVIMWRLVYRNLGGIERLVGNFVTDVNGADGGGVRWFELRNTAGWSLFQEGTYVGPTGSFDGVHRWMGSIAMDGAGNIAVEYNVSNTSIFPGIRYTGRLASDPVGTMPQGEFVAMNGQAVSGITTRWGDYSSLTIDPADDCTFWGTNNYGASAPIANRWNTRVFTFSFGADCVPPASADLSVTKTDGLTSVTAGDPVTYTIVVTNAGPDPVVGAPVVDTFPVELLTPSWTCAASAGSACADSGPTAGNINTTVDLLVGGTATFTVTGTVDPTATGTLVNTATATTPIGTTDPVPGNNSQTDTTTIIPLQTGVDVSIFKTDGLTNASPGDTITYTITVGNAGPEDAPFSTVTDTFPAYLTNVSWTCAAVAPSACGAANGVGDINEVDVVDLTVGNPVTYTVTATIDPAITECTVSNTATVTPYVEVSPDTNPDNNSSTDTTNVCDEPPPPPPDITDPGLSKIGVLQPGQLGLPGEQITWIVTLVNTTGAPLTNVVISDTMQPELQIDSVTTSIGSASFSGQNVTVLIPFLNVGETATINIVTTVLNNPDAPYFENFVTMTADGGRFAEASARVPTVSGLPDTGYPPGDE